MVCWNSEKPGHMKSECRAPRKDKEGRTTNVATEDTADALLLSVRSSLDDWIVDSGASFHSCSSRDIMKPYTAGAVSQSHLWHSRLGHMSEKRMKVLKSRGLLPELESVDVGLCKQCVLGKQKRVRFTTTGRAPKTEKLELAHTNLWGPAPEESDGTKRYKARLVVKGFQQRYGIDFTDVLTPVVKSTTIRLVLSMVAVENLDLQQLDVKTAFLHGDLEEEIYMVQPEGYRGNDQQACRLKKSLYGLKQAPRQWYRKFDNFVLEIGYSRCNADHCCYVKRFGNSFIILLLYVDDMLIAGSDVKEIERLKDHLSMRFDMKDLGEAIQILGMKITRDRNAGKLWLSQSDYIEKVLCRFKMDIPKPIEVPLGSQFKLSNKDSPKDDSEKERMRVMPYASAIGSLMYAMEVVKWILRYLRGTKDRALVFGRGTLTLSGFVDADFAGSDHDKRRSTTGYVFTYGGTAVSWISKLQKIVTLSTTEAEYVAVTEAAKELVWLQNFLNELGRPQEDVALCNDSQSAIHLAKNPAFHSRTKHIKVKYHFIRQLLEKKMLQLKKIRGDINPADMLTKARDDHKRVEVTQSAIRLKDRIGQENYRGNPLRQ
ncbi:cysteine-rich RLK (RECEPTOR-like protein kinase) 8 [Striga hermonthica]|uniref:Cysteine-rich RLK (RECEPTOR-like protein kinase) 8 n=1 Tax=Striga hermonthica TaxID=68872 RepID=A0A9N7RGN1_STRHE|nr:cysteine-rich RLK (RECEPTOR-like protein kinase) 8 [Striga hermonthica]